MTQNHDEKELVTELGKIERHRLKLEERKEGILDELGERGSHGHDPYPEGTPIIDCGDKGEIIAVDEDDGETIYTIEFEEYGGRILPASEIEIGIIDGTIQVGAP